jgi:anion-transporting  ArsA/GET3 family ATPase
MLDAKLVADAAVRKLVPRAEDVEKLLGNSIYKHVTTMVAGMHEYTAMHALHEFVSENRYELIVLDTPPSRHALDFLEAPGRLARFLDGRVFRMFMPTSNAGGVARFTGGVVHRVLGTVLGEQFASDLSVFFGTFGSVLGTISRDVTGMRSFLSGEGVAFVLVTSPAPAALEEALFFEGKTRELGLPFKGYVLNRSAAAGSKGRQAPTAEAFAAETGAELDPAALRALPKLLELAEAEVELIERDSTLLTELKERAGTRGFAAALPLLDPSLSEFEQVIGLANAVNPLRSDPS